MKLEEAERLLKLYLNQPNISDDPEIQDAIRLAIEAISFIELSRGTTPGSVPTLLHGETEN